MTNSEFWELSILLLAIVFLAGVFILNKISSDFLRELE